MMCVYIYIVILYIYYDIIIMGYSKMVVKWHSGMVYPMMFGWRTKMTCTWFFQLPQIPKKIWLFVSTTYRKTPGKEQHALAPVLCTLNWAQSRHGRWLPEASTHKKTLKGPKPQPRLVFIQKLLGAWDLWIAIPPSIPWPMGFDIWKRWKFPSVPQDKLHRGLDPTGISPCERWLPCWITILEKNTWNQPIGPSHPIS